MTDATLASVPAPAPTDPSAPRQLRRIRTRPSGRALLPWVVPILVLLGWQWASSTGVISAAILPPPMKVLDTAVNLWSTGELQDHLLVSVRRIMLGFAIGASIGLALGFAVGLRAPAKSYQPTSGGMK